MRVAFPGGEHDDILIGAREASVGSAADNTIVIDRSGIAPHHAKFSMNEHGVVLTIIDPDARTHVNMRPVREKAILRLGDVVSLDTVQLVLKPDHDTSIRTDIPAVQALTPLPSSPVGRIHPSRVLLRGLNGPESGKIIAVGNRLTVGSGPGTDLVLDAPDMARVHAAIETTADTIVLRDLGSLKGSVVNGVGVRDAYRNPGDQLVFDGNRFLIEAPGFKARRDTPVPIPASPNITQTMRAIQPAQIPDAAPVVKNPAPNPSGKNDIWWLLGVALLIALGVALLFLGKF